MHENVDNVKCYYYLQLKYIILRNSVYVWSKLHGYPAQDETVNSLNITIPRSN